ncbi:MAG: SufD family Fe-S cluster assembly protein [Peptoniphilaceae bacterium]|nr:SufD family Fe-S cluster assembly protein [Peptoniphilaceae bacterium]
MYKVNEMRMPTWRQLGLNYVEYRPKIMWSSKYYKKGSRDVKNTLDLAFKDKDYGLSEDILNENKEYENFIFYKEVEGKKETQTINLDLNDENTSLVSRIDIEAKEGSESSFLVNFTSTNSKEAILNSLIRIKLGKNAKAKLVVITNIGENTTNLQSIASIIADDAFLDLSYIELGSDYSLVSIKNYLSGENSKLEENGVYFKQKDEFMDMLALNEHRAKVTASNSIFNGALKDRAIKQWKGVVDLKRGCQKADGKIGDYSMMLSDEVVNKSAPILLNNERDVSGKHAASVGRLNKDMLYYIMSRGFSKKKAQTLMLEANFAPCLDKIEDENLRNELKAKVHAMNIRTDE